MKKSEYEASRDFYITRQSVPIVEIETMPFELKIHTFVCHPYLFGKPSNVLDSERLEHLTSVLNLDKIKGNLSDAKKSARKVLWTGTHFFRGQRFFMFLRDAVFFDTKKLSGCMMIDHSLLSKIIKGQRKLSEKSVENISKFYGIDKSIIVYGPTEQDAVELVKNLYSFLYEQQKQKCTEWIKPDIILDMNPSCVFNTKDGQRINLYEYVKEKLRKRHNYFNSREYKLTKNFIRSYNYAVRNVSCFSP